MTIVLAERFGVLPDAVENMDVYWFDRAVEYFSGEAMAQRENAKPKR